MRTIKSEQALAVGLALMSLAGTAQAQQRTEPATAPPVLETVLVTATKRATDLQSTAGSISALGAQQIDNRSLVGMEDYLDALPSVNYIDRGVGENQIIIRGIGLAFGERATVGSYFGEVPLSNPIISTSSDMKLVDMERIEVLRGPQGTLYGGGSMSGAVRNIPNAPYLDEFEGRVAVDYSSTDGADGGNGDVTAMLNLPLGDELALRLVGYRFDNAGYVDLVSTELLEDRSAATGTPVAEKEGVGGNRFTGARASLLWQPSDELDVTLMVAHQELEEDGRNDVTLSRQAYEASALATGKEFKTDELSLFNLLVNYDMGWGTLTSSTSWVDGKTADSSDLGRVIDWAAVGFSERDKEGLVQELRVASQFDGKLQVTGGLYYEDFESFERCCWRWTGDDPSLNPFGTENLRTVNTLSTIDQVAVFGELDYALTDALVLTVGGRWFDYERDDDIDESGPLAAIPNQLSTAESDSRYKAGIDYQLHDDALLYALWSEGFRLGLGVATAPPTICDVDNDGLMDGTTISLGSSSIDSDTTENFELGGKFSFWDRRVSLNSSVYRIDWTDIPVGAVGSNPVCSATVNGGEARSQGVELEAQVLLTSSLSLQLAASYTDAEFTNNQGGNEGERLPMSPEHNGYVGLHYDFLLAQYPAFLRADATYVGAFNTGATIPTESGDYVTVDLNAGITVDNVELKFYASNLTNEDDVTVAFFLDRGWRLRPRTLGVQLAYRF
ncbi:TonB-dependent receptor [Parahaliea mediterranea]|uniref:TonB-dependent receptor n=1 Tax=Parahaliea mediterranea TaxID=651086 RepID=UPI000E2E98A3|nr:TonB-dependent receptor [Parahaliea mediterranea]